MQSAAFPMSIGRSGLPSIAQARTEVPSVNLRRVLLFAGIASLLYFVTDHDWGISRYEDFAAGSDFMETATADGSVIRRIAIFAMGGASLFVLLRQAGYPLRIRGAMAILMFAAAAWCIASWGWSIDRSLSARRLIASSCEALAALAAARALKPRELALAALVCGVAFFGVGVVAEIAQGTFHPWRGDYRFAGTLHPNNQGINCALIVLAASYFAVYSNSRKMLFWLLVGVGAVGLWLTKSRTPVAALAVAELLFWFFTASNRQKVVWVLVGLGVASLTVLIAGEGIFDRVSQAVLMGRADEDETSALTGRVPLWEELGESIAQRPLTGYGFSSFWIPEHIEDFSDSQSWAISVAHSAYLDLALGIGLVGAVLCMLVVIWGLVLATKAHLAAPPVGFGFIAVLLLFALIHGVTESAFANPGYVPLVELAGLAMLAFVDPREYGLPAASGLAAKSQ